MVKKIKKYLKFVVCCTLILSLIAPSYAALSASDGSAFVTKAEFDSALADFNARLTTFEAGINSKIDSQVSSYLDRNGIWNAQSIDVSHNFYIENNLFNYMPLINPRLDADEVPLPGLIGAVLNNITNVDITNDPKGNYALMYILKDRSWYPHYPVTGEYTETLLICPDVPKSGLCNMSVQWRAWGAINHNWGGSRTGAWPSRYQCWTRWYSPTNYTALKNGFMTTTKEIMDAHGADWQGMGTSLHVTGDAYDPNFLNLMCTYFISTDELNENKKYTRNLLSYTQSCSPIILMNNSNGQYAGAKVPINYDPLSEEIYFFIRKNDKLYIHLTWTVGGRNPDGYFVFTSSGADYGALVESIFIPQISIY